MADDPPTAGNPTTPPEATPRTTTRAEETQPETTPAEERHLTAFPRSLVRVEWSSTKVVRYWKQHLFVVALAVLVGLPLVLGRLGPAVRKNGFDEDGWLWVGFGLIAYAVVRALVAVFGKPPVERGDRWRVPWAVGLASVLILLTTHTVFAWYDRFRTEGSESACANQVGTVDQAVEPLESEASTIPASTVAVGDESEPTDAGSPDDTFAPEATEVSDTEPSDAATESTTVEVATVVTPIDTATGGRPREEFGPQRQLQWHTFVVNAGSTAQAREMARIGCGAFVVVADDDRPTSAFVSSVTPLADGQLAVRLTVDTTKIDSLDGGSYRVTAVNSSDVPLEQNRLELEVVLQSRFVYYLLALVPAIVVAAMMQAFETWPEGLKRWFTSIVAIASPAVTAFAATGLRNDRWGPTLFSTGALIAATYTAAVTAATVANRAGSGGQPQQSENPAPPAAGG